MINTVCRILSPSIYLGERYTEQINTAFDFDASQNVGFSGFRPNEVWE